VVYEQENRPLTLRDAPTAAQYANSFVPASQRVEHGVLRPEVLPFSVSPTNRVIRPEHKTFKRLAMWHMKLGPCGRCINTRRRLAFIHIVAHRTKGEATVRN
jgi:hypothetical protein